jgi:hypothetical protein
MDAVAIDLDGALGDTCPLWRDWVEDVWRRARLEVELPGDRGEAAALLALERRLARLGRMRTCSGRRPSSPYNRRMADQKILDDRQLDAVLERLDGLRAELQQLNSRLDHTEGYLALAHELRSLNESLQALAYAALGQQGPQVRRRRTG